MALEIRDHGAHPLFYGGVQYAGSLEPHVLALAFTHLRNLPHDHSCCAITCPEDRERFRAA